MTTQPDSPVQDSSQVGGGPPPVPVRPPGLLHHVPVAVAAVLVGLICGLPHVFMARQARAQGMVYAPLVAEDVTRNTFDQLACYAPRIREVLDGHLLSGDAHGWEHKRELPFLGQSWLDSLLAGGLAFLVGRDVPNVFIVCDFLLPPLSFLLLFAICRVLGAPRWVAIAGALLGVLAADQVTLLIALAARPSLERLRESLSLGERLEPLDICRLTTPQLTFILCLASLWSLLVVYERPRPRRIAVAGLLLGLNFYCYVYYWTFVLMGAALLLVAGAAFSRERRAVRPLLLALGIGIIIGLPVILQLTLPDGFHGREELAVRAGGVTGGLTLGAQKHRILLMVLFLVVYPWRRREYLPVGAFLLAPYACVVAARLVGMGVQDWHWIRRCWMPWAAVAAVLLTWHVFRWLGERRACHDEPTASPAEASRFIPAFFAGLSVMVLVYAANVQFSFAARMSGSYNMPHDLRDALRELHVRAAPDSVVMGLDTSLTALVPVYTPCNIYVPFSHTTPMGTEELMDRAARTFAAYGLPAQTVARLLEGHTQKDPMDVRLNRERGLDYVDWLFLLTEADRSAPVGTVEALQAKAAFYSPRRPEDVPGPYRADFILWGPRERELGREDLEEALAPRLFIEAGDYRIYRISEGARHQLQDTE